MRLAATLAATACLPVVLLAVTPSSAVGVVRGAPPMVNTAACGGLAVDGVPLPGEEAGRKGRRLKAVGDGEVDDEVPSECPSLHYPCSRAYKKLVRHAWGVMPINHTAHRVPWNYYDNAPWGETPDKYLAYAGKFDSVVDPLLVHLAQARPAMVVAGPTAGDDVEPTTAARSWPSHDASGTALSTPWAVDLKRALTRMNKDKTPVFCEASEQRWLFANASADVLTHPGRNFVYGELPPKKVESQGLPNLVPLQDACTHVLVHDIPQDCNGSIVDFLQERLHGPDAGLYAKDTQRLLKGALQAAQAAMPAPTQCNPNLILPRAVLSPRLHNEKGVVKRARSGGNVLCTVGYSYYGPLFQNRWGGVQNMDGFQRTKTPSRRSLVDECKRPRDGGNAMFTDGRLLNGSNPRVAPHIRSVLRSLAPVVLVTPPAADVMPWDQRQFGRMAYEMKAEPWAVNFESLEIARARVPDVVSILDMPEVAAWYTVNPTITHPKLRGLPIGPMCHQVDELLSAYTGADKAAIDTTQPRHFRLLVNYGALHTKKDCEGVRAMVAATAVQRWPFATVLPPSILKALGIAGEEYRKLLTKFRFVLSPPGSGWNCFRIFDAIAAGAVPVIIRTGASTDTLYEKLPVLYVNSYDDITADLLDREWERLSKERFDFSTLSTKYWARLIEESAALSTSSSP
eukprot:m.202355 g.202355  ORF g.202355 m.202355 type:complete len:683 (+) comp21743_c0_seq1:84-2132(+)